MPPPRLPSRLPVALLAAVGALAAAAGAWASASTSERPDSALPPGAAEADRVNLERNLRWVIERERAPRPAGAAAAARVGVLADAGAWHEGARATVAALEAEGVPVRVLDRSLLEPRTLAGLDAIVLPGGWAAHQSGALGGPGLEALRARVEGGATCLGVCAGAFLLSARVRWEGETFPYPLGLFDGDAEGPLADLAPWPRRAAVRLEVTGEGRRRGLGPAAGRPLLYFGGPRFTGGTEVEVWARYPDGSAAVVTRRVGRGRVVLSGVHPEIAPPEADGTSPPEAPRPADAGAILKALLLGK